MQIIAALCVSCLATQISKEKNQSSTRLKGKCAARFIINTLRGWNEKEFFDRFKTI